jgi:hypothetical protein
MADFTTGEEAAAKKAARSFKKYQYRGVELDQLLDLDNEKLIEVCYPGWMEHDKKLTTFLPFPMSSIRYFTSYRYPIFVV